MSDNNYIFQSQNGLILTYCIFYYDVYTNKFQSQNGLILTKKHFVKISCLHKFQSQNGLILTLSRRHMRV